MEELQIREPLFVPATQTLEMPTLLLEVPAVASGSRQVKDNEIKVPRVLTAEEQAAVDAAKAREEERLANEVCIACD